MALGLPFYTSNERLSELGIYNTFGEIRDSLLIAQKERLARTKMGRAILWKIGILPRDRLYK